MSHAEFNLVQQHGTYVSMGTKQVTNVTINITQCNKVIEFIIHNL